MNDMVEKLVAIPVPDLLWVPVLLGNLKVVDLTSEKCIYPQHPVEFQNPSRIPNLMELGRNHSSTTYKH
jgi:hypothetical protein